MTLPRCSLISVLHQTKQIKSQIHGINENTRWFQLSRDICRSQYELHGANAISEFNALFRLYQRGGITAAKPRDLYLQNAKQQNLASAATFRPSGLFLGDVTWLDQPLTSPEA